MEKHGTLVWVRRDLRFHDHTVLAHAATLGEPVAVVFVFDPQLLDPLPKNDRRLTFIHASLEELDQKLRAKGSSLIVRYGNPREEIPAVAKVLRVARVLTGRDYEPFAKDRDASVEKALAAKGVGFQTFKDQVIFEGLEVKNLSGEAYRVFTPYKNAWLKQLKAGDYDDRQARGAEFLAPPASLIHAWDLKKLGFEETLLWLKAGEDAGRKRLKSFIPHLEDYGKARDFPAEEGTSGLSVHLRFGTISIRDCVRTALAHPSPGASIWLSELIWREFYHMILDQNPHVVGHAYKKEYEKIRWPGSDAHFKAWCEGRTGFPLVDAAMRHFNKTGWMHNRLRMVVASFLTKDLLVDWRKGEAYFAAGLLDFDLAANNGGWQWSASTGCDAQPYFRIFNPYSQSKRFDPDGAFIRAQIPELKMAKNIHQPEGSSYPKPLVEHGAQRAKALALFKK